MSRAGLFPIMGNLGQDPVVEKTPSGATKVMARVATDKVWHDANGGHHKKTEWHPIAAWGNKPYSAGWILAKAKRGQGIAMLGEWHHWSVQNDDGTWSRGSECVAVELARTIREKDEG